MFLLAMLFFAKTYCMICQAALQLEDIPNPQDLVVKYREKERDSPDGAKRHSHRRSSGADYDGGKGWQGWAVKYGIAAIAVGLGVILFKH